MAPVRPVTRVARIAALVGAAVGAASLLGACNGPLASLLGTAGIPGGGASGSLAGNNSGIVGNNNSGIVGNNNSGIVGNNNGGLISDNSSAFSGTVAAPSALVGNNVAGLVSNNAGGLVGNNASSYRVMAWEDVQAPGALVYLSNPDERLYTSGGRVVSTTTDSKGFYEFGEVLPEGQYVVVNAMLAGNRRLVGLVVSAKGRNRVDVNVAATYVMEMLRSEARRAGKTFANYDLARLPALVGRTRDMLVAGRLGLDPDRLVVGKSALLVDDYVAALADDPAALADWTALLGHKPAAAVTVAGTYGFGLNGAEPATGRGAPAFGPRAVAAGGDMTFVALQNMHQIMALDPAGMWSAVTGRVTAHPATEAAPHVPGDGAVTAATRIPQPVGLAADAAGNLLVTMNDSVDAPRNVLLLLNANATPKFGRQDLQPGRIYRVAGILDPVSDETGFSAPGGLALDDAGNVFVADIRNDRVMRVSRETGAIARVAGTGRGSTWASVHDGAAQALQSPLFAPSAVAWRRVGAGEELYVLDSYFQRVRQVVAPGGVWSNAVMRTIAGSGTPAAHAGAPVVAAGFGGDGGPALSARFGFALTDTGNWEASQFSQAGLAIDAARHVLYVSDPLNRRVRAIDLASGTVRTVAGGGGNARDGLAHSVRFAAPAGLAVMQNGDVVVADREAHAVRRVTLGE